MTITTANITSELDSIAEQIPIYSREEMARTAWALITDPGDTDAVTLVREYGGETALKILVDARQRVLRVELDDLDALRKRALPRLSSAKLIVSLRSSARLGIQILTPSHEHWPSGLDSLDNRAPHALFVQGKASLLASSCLTLITGERAASGYGEHCAHFLSVELSRLGHTIINGGDYGIEGEAIKATLAAAGSAVVVAAGSLDHRLPAGHDFLLSQVALAGAIVSEHPVSTMPSELHYERRTLLMVAMSHRAVIVEAGVQKESLRAATTAAGLGVPFGCVPGLITSEQSKGCHRALKELGARLITSVDDITALSPPAP